MMVTRHISRKGLVMIELPEMVVFSLYFSPNGEMQEHEQPEQLLNFK
jgi:hypothetical protein